MSTRIPAGRRGAAKVDSATTSQNATAPIENGANGDGDKASQQVSAPIENGANGDGDKATSSAKPDARDKLGRFVAGNRGGPGNPFMRHISRFRWALCQALSEEDLRAVVKTLIEQAKAGNMAATTVLLTHCIGRPTTAPDPDAVAVHEWKLTQDSEVPDISVTNVLGTLPAQLACDIVRQLWPAQTKERDEALAAMERGELPPKPKAVGIRAP